MAARRVLLAVSALVLLVSYAAAGELANLKVGALAYFSYQDGEGFGGEDYSEFRLKRCYLNFKLKPKDNLVVRVTPDVHQDSSGDWKLRLKYAYARFLLPDIGILGKPYVEAGLIHMPWLDFEEHLNFYRMQDTMFMEREKLFNSADMGVMFGCNLGPQLPQKYREKVNSHYAGRYGSIQLGIYNGGGYHEPERNDNKVLEGRISLRPLPDVLPGLQFSLFALTGKGNTEESPDWNVGAAMASLETVNLVVTLQAVDAKGNQSGSAVGPDGEALDGDGYSGFLELRTSSKRWAVIARYDRFDLADRRNTRNIVGLAYAPNSFLKFLLDYQREEKSRSLTGDAHRLQLTMQLSI